MKKTKIVALTASLALSASLVLGMTACAGGVNSLYGDDYTYTAPTMTATALDALDGYTIDNTNGMDKFGIITAQKDVTPEATEAEPDPDTETEYILYDAVANKQIATTTKTDVIPSAAWQVYTKIIDGLYRYTETLETTGERTYIYYGKSGVVKTSNELITPPVNSSDSRVTFSDGTMLVVAEDGTVNTYTLGIKPVFMPEAFMEYKDVYVQSLGTPSYRVWNAEGEIVREVDLSKELSVPESASSPVTWTVGNSMFIQYAVVLPLDAADYDYTENMYKYDLVTKSYNYENGKVTEHNFDGIVSVDLDTAYSDYSDDGVFLNVRTISDKQPGASATLQYYGEDGKVLVDVQDLLPEANDVTVYGEYVVLESPATISVYNTEGELLGSADASAVTFKDGYFVRSGSTTIVYNLAGEQVFSGKETAGHGGAYGEKVYRGIANGLIYYTIETEGTATSENPFPSSTTTVYTYSEADGDKTLGEGEIIGMSSPLLQDIVYIYNSSSEDYTAYIKGYADPVATGLDSAIALTAERTSTLDDASYTLYSYTETVTSGSGETQTTERVTKYVFVTIA